MTRQDWTLAVGLAAIVVAVSTGTCSTNARIGDLASQIGGQVAELRMDLRGLDWRLRAVEVGLAKVDQRLTAVEAAPRRRREAARGSRTNRAGRRPVRGSRLR